VAVRADGKILAGGCSISIGGQRRGFFARLNNDTTAMQDLNVTQTSITWTLGCSSPQFTRVSFESSTDGVNYSPLGNGTPAGPNWIPTGLSLVTGQNYYIRARGYYRSGYFNGSESIMASVRNAFFARWCHHTGAAVGLGGDKCRRRRCHVGHLHQNSDTAPNDAFLPDQNGISDKYLDTSATDVISSSAVLRSRNNFDMEFSDGTYWDGCVLEVSSPNINGGAFTDVTDSAVGGSFVTGGYVVNPNTAPFTYPNCYAYGHTNSDGYRSTNTKSDVSTNHQPFDADARSDR
jgi:hypothetical protein